MKKFSKEINQTIKEEPKEQVNPEIQENKKIKQEIIALIDRSLKSKAYGPVDNRYLAGKVVIEGKETLAEYLINFFENKCNDNKRMMLESLKNNISNWKAIDEKIETIENDINVNNKIKFQKILERYNDEESLVLFFNDKKLDKKTSKDYFKLLEKTNLKQNTINEIKKKL